MFDVVALFCPDILPVKLEKGGRALNCFFTRNNKEERLERKESLKFVHQKLRKVYKRGEKNES